ncbi:hypothetical protein EOM39_06025 [Candidatus Gracilibacteria bacterium]|nr:hypothetical protein [Candidatus Gracilibacteria bacterium]
MILITKTFLKLLSKIKSVGLDDISLEINKHKTGLDNFKIIGTIENRKILKGYLLSKKIRLVVLFQEKNGSYLPFYLAKKETKDGYNISKYSLDEIVKKLDNIFIDLENGDYEIID